MAEIIRKEYKDNKIFHKNLAIKYKVSAATIGFIINNKIWRNDGII